MSSGWLRMAAADGGADLRPQDYPWDDPTELARHGTVIKHSATRAVIRLDAADDSPRPLYIKRYRFDDLRRRIKTALGYSRAMDERRACIAVHARGIGAPRPLFAGDRRLGPLRYESFLVTEAIDAAVSADVLIERTPEAKLAGVLRALGRIVGHLHLRGVFHDDLKPAHILLAGGELPAEDLTGVSLIDLYRCRVGRVPSTRRRGVNLAQLYAGIATATSEHKSALLGGFGEVVDLSATARARLERSVDKAIRIRRRRRRRAAAGN